MELLVTGENQLVNLMVVDTLAKMRQAISNHHFDFTITKRDF